MHSCANYFLKLRKGDVFMQFRKMDQSLLIYKEELKENAKRINKRLNFSREVFEAKCKKVRVHMELTPDEESRGFLEKDFQNKTTKLCLTINPNDGFDFISFIMCHELYHLLYSPMSPMTGTGYNPSDQSCSINHIMRYNFSRGEVIGSQLNEQIANLFAYETILHDKSICEEPSKKFKEIMSFIDGPMKPIKKLISAFQIDTQSSYCLEAGKMVDGLFVPNNLFTYGITTGKSELFVRKYEEIMGAYSWGRLNKKIDTFYTSFDLEDGKQIKRELEQFERVFKKR